jgi:hypothetical protein
MYNLTSELTKKFGKTGEGGAFAPRSDGDGAQA